jgi:isopentenyl diphosphate isomerase/L-lactate dehydrogenase-like FMN-dependent dehydrogenase
LNLIRVRGQDEAVETSRRALLKFALGSPLLLSSATVPAIEWIFAEAARAEGAGSSARELIARASDGIDVFDYEMVAKTRLDPGHWTFLSMGVQHELTLRENRSAFDEILLRPRRLVDTRDLDTSTRVLGETLRVPVLLCPCGSQRAFHVEGELAVARAARERDWVQVLSAGTSTPLEKVAEARTAPLWSQLYTPRILPYARSQLRAAEEVGCPVLVLTVDQIGVGQNRDRLRRFNRRENPACVSCHDSLAEDVLEGASTVLEAFGRDPIDLASDHMTLDWDFVDRLRDSTDMKLVIKGIVTAEDAALCVEHGVDGIFVSNHGGRAEDTGMSSISSLVEIAAAVGPRMPLLVDSGFRRGTDLFKALALGASAVGVGRPYLWGLAAFGQEGVEAVLEILERELSEIMVEMGTRTVADISAEHVRVGVR